MERTVDEHEGVESTCASKSWTDLGNDLVIKQFFLQYFEDRIAYDMRATCYYKMNEPAKALADYDKCIEIKPDDHRSSSECH